MQAVLSAIMDAVAAAGPCGAPGGIIYAALFAQGCTLNQFQTIMDALVRAGKVTRDGECYHIATPTL
jgi:hypothetical protein